MMEFGVVNWFAEVISVLLVLALLGGIVIIVVIYVIDVTQTASAIRRNYPVIGRFRYLFETLGEFFRQYFVAMDREESPFNRAQRSWVYSAAKNIDSPPWKVNLHNLKRSPLAPITATPTPRPLYSIFRV